jgi:uncharacterized protein (TIGR02270 family)
MDLAADAPLAAEAFCAITGLDLGRERLALPDPLERDQPLRLEEDDLDANLVPTIEDLLPRPDVAGIKRWWESQRPRFKEGGRYIGGNPVTMPALQAALATAPMRRRHALALELAVRTAGRCDVATRAFATVQSVQMRGFESAPAARTIPSSLARRFSAV